MTTLDTLEKLADAAWEKGREIDVHLGYSGDKAGTYVVRMQNKTLKQLIELIRMQHEALEEARSVREGLINWRQKAWPGIDQRLVIDRDYPHIPVALAAYDKFEGGE